MQATSSSRFPSTHDQRQKVSSSQQQPQTPTPRAAGAIARTVSEGSTTGKRKADEVDPSGTPPDKREQKTTFAADTRPHRQSATSATASTTAPSSYHRKRARLSNASSSDARSPSRAERSGHHQLQSSPSPPSRAHLHHQHLSSHARTSSTASRASRRNTAAGTVPFAAIFDPPQEEKARPRPPSRSARPASYAPSSIRKYVPSVHRAPSRASRRSISGASIPISALVAPRAPSVSVASQSRQFHMRDPRKPPRVQPTPWSLSLPSPGDEDHPWWKPWRGDNASPIQAWLFFVSFVLFPLWWVGGFIVGIPKTRRIGDTPDLEKGKTSAIAPRHTRDDSVVLDDPQVEHDSRSWRRRCRIMAVVSLFTYVPFIVCIAVFAPR
ncbi:hypothetical protein BD626DRAFT_507965 [Schizophyllum amplum]|uniref:Uncharacterized protein n=1 Tax=Schizophyllum amplum TaxID=97359 RepID=A0A550BV85_9AGAR|nr:hypothetical protein BD626DRAFT_519726 [Auriculariopsis ampla]TRM59318.1 hypothetical protein BD626DRAFT_507965 [Auriculariopsis ampla]